MSASTLAYCRLICCLRLKDCMRNLWGFINCRDRESLARSLLWLYKWTFAGTKDVPQRCASDPVMR